MNFFETNLDGMRSIGTLERFEKNDYVYVNDQIYKEEPNLFKVKKNNETEIDFKIVNVAIGKVLNEEEVEEYDNKKLAEISDGNLVLYFEGRVSKQQIIKVNNDFFEIVDIKKEKGRINLLEVEKVAKKEAFTVYKVYRTKKTGGETELYKIYDNYLEAIISISESRGKNDDYFYRFI